ncbi:ABC transporter transmembrane domain-containing protein [Faecalibacterium hattorii]|uniref:ABC transporter transmembrane domain-containing protein n=1 Tax=Faecalibacterium hattorii TaxID=2935520 RepID=UPI003AB04CD2
MALSRFTQGQTGDYINTITSDVNNYEKILTHKVGDLAKNFALSFMLIVFVMTIYVPAGIILLIADLLLIPGLWLSFRMVQKYGKEKNDICAENVSSIVEYVSGIQTFRAYGVGGMKNKTVINAMREFSRISFVYEVKVLPIGTGFGILSWLSCPLVNLAGLYTLGCGDAEHGRLPFDLYAALVLCKAGQTLDFL